MEQQITQYAGFAELIEARCAEAPHATAFFYEDAEGKRAQLSWEAFAARVAKRSEELAAEAKACEAVLCDGSLACLVEIFAANVAGLQLVLLEDTMNDEQVAALLTPVSVDAVWCRDAERAAELSCYLDMHAEPAEADAHQILFFTSGTTARSKAVVLTDSSLMASAWNGSAMLPLSPSDTLLACLPFAHVFGFVCGVLWALNCGAAVALGRGKRHYVDDLAFFQPTAISVVPALLAFFLAHELVNPELKLVLVGAGDCDLEPLDAARALGLRVSFGYGLTELSSGVALSLGEDPYAMSVCPGAHITLAEDGEILVEAPSCVMKGYYRDAQATAEVLHDGVLHTGDLGIFDADDCLRILGRKKETLVLSSGTKLFLPEYEARIAEVLGTSELAVVLREGKPWLITPAEIAPEQEVLKRLELLMYEYGRDERLAGVFVLGHELPRTEVGKLVRWQLREELERLW